MARVRIGRQEWLCSRRYAAAAQGLAYGGAHVQRRVVDRGVETDIKGSGDLLKVQDDGTKPGRKSVRASERSLQG